MFCHVIIYCSYHVIIYCSHPTGSPKKVSYDHIYQRLLELDGVKSVHSLKIWSLTSNEINASVHLAVGKTSLYACCEKSCVSELFTSIAYLL